MNYIEKICDINGTGATPPTAYVRTYGCQQNVSDGEKIRGLLAACGYRVVSGKTRDSFSDNDNVADLIIFNTCAVRENAENRVFGNVGALKALKKRNPSLIIALCGCMVQQERVKDKLLARFPFVDIIFGTHAIPRLPQLLYKALSECRLRHKGHIVDIGTDENLSECLSPEEHLPLQRMSGIKASVPVMYGCNNFCTYCIVPYVRGRERSRSIEAVTAECAELLDEGYRELFLLGQNVNSYDGGGVNFAELLRRLDNLSDDEYVISYMTSHPKDFTRELIDVIAAGRHISHHIHLPVQSGSDRVLKLMNRSYTREQYMELVRYAKAAIPDLRLTTDIIVGFPGETYDDFCETLSVIKETRYASAYTFIYSPREGTAAAEMPDPVTAAEKGLWFRELCALQERIGDEVYGGYVGTVIRVLCEGCGRDAVPQTGDYFTNDIVMTGRGKNGITVEFTGNDSDIGKFYDVEITGASRYILSGRKI